MHALGSSRRSGEVDSCRIMLVGLVAGMATLPLCLGIENFLADAVLNKLESSLGQSGARQDRTALEALYLENECSDDFLECQKPGALSDPATLRCFTICIAVETGCRSRCSEGACYQPPGTDGGLGSCLPCIQDRDGEQELSPPGRRVALSPTGAAGVPVGPPPWPQDQFQEQSPESPQPDLVPAVPPFLLGTDPPSSRPPSSMREYYPPPEPPPDILAPPTPHSPASGIVDFPPECPLVPPPSFERGHMCGDGAGTATFIDFDGPDVSCTADGSQLCSERIFGVDCTVYNGTIGIWFGTSMHDIPAQVLEGHLSRLGLNSITYILEDLLLMLPAGPVDAPVLVLSIFKDLFYVGGTLTVDVNVNETSSLQISRQVQLAALQKVTHIGGNLNIRNTRLKDLSAFGALACVGRALGYGRSSNIAPACASSNCHTDGKVVLSGNEELVSCNGLQSLRSVTRSISEMDGAALMDLSALTWLARCTDGVQIGTRFRIRAAACPGATLMTWSHVCAYISSRRCPLQLQPPPSTCTRITPATPVCDPTDPVTGTVVHYLIWDRGNGSCTLGIKLNGTVVATSDCSKMIFGRQCEWISAHIWLMVSNDFGNQGRPYVPPKFDKWLQQLGLNGVSVITQSLHVWIQHTEQVVPGPLSLNFLPNLQRIEGSLAIREFPNPAIKPFVPALSALPGLGRLSIVSQAIFVTRTGLTDFTTSLTGLRCSPFESIYITNNPNLQHLEGLNMLSPYVGGTDHTDTLTSPGPSTQITFNPKLDDISALSVFGQCPSGRTTGTVMIATKQCAKNLNSWAAACAFIANYACNASPPRPPSSPPSPPSTPPPLPFPRPRPPPLQAGAPPPSPRTRSPPQQARPLPPFPRPRPPPLQANPLPPSQPRVPPPLVVQPLPP